MSHSSRFLVAVVTAALGSWLLPACGGSFESGGGDSGSGGQAGGTGGGGAGRGGSASAGKGGSAGGGTTNCEFDGNTYADGDSFPAGDDCNTCSCASGEVICTQKACSDACIYDGMLYQVGDSFPADDGCNTCTCEGGGAVSCTLIGCTDVCTDLENVYGAAIEEARSCDPSLSGQCSEVVFVGLACGCESFANPEYLDALTTAEAARADYNAQDCGGDVLCGACLAPSSSYCSAEGRCVDVYEYGAGASCQVDGLVYDSGSASVPDPFSCNLCTCTDGHLDCDSADCPELCPPEMVAGTQCVQCGNSAEACEVIEHACLPVCGSGLPCQDGSVCVAGVCKTLCG